MAQIPMGNLGNSVAGPGQMTRAPGPGSLGNAIAAGGAAVANEGINTLRRETELADQRKRAQANTAMARTENELHDASDAISKQVLDGSLPTDQAHAEFDKVRQKVTSANLEGWDPNSQAVMQGHFEQLGGTLNRALSGVVEKRKQDETLGTIKDFGEEQQRIAMREGPDKAAARYGAMLDTTGPAAGLGVTQISVMKQKFAEGVTMNFFDAAATGALEKEDTNALRSLREDLDGKKGDVMDPANRSAMKRTIMSYERQIEANRQSRAAESKYDLINRSKDTQAMVLAGEVPPQGTAPSQAEYVAAYGPTGAARWKNEVGNYLAVGDVMLQMKQANPEERRQMVASAAPQAGEGYAGQLEVYQAAVKSNQIIEKQLFADPASYALKNSPRVQRAFKVMQDAPPEDKQAAMDFYARTTVAEQLRLGVTSVRDETAGNKAKQPRILTNEQANAISDQFNDQAFGGAKAVAVIEGLEATYGRYWPQVYGQLAADNKLPPSALVIPNMQDPGARSRMAQASVTKNEVFDAQLQAGDKNDISESLQKQFSEARVSFASQGIDGTRTLSTVMGEAEKLTKLYVTQGKSVGDASKQAFTEVMGWKYSFQDGYRVPKTEDAIAVSGGARNVLAGIKATDIRPFTTGGGISDEQASAMSLDAIKAHGTWITNGDESGLRLTVQGQDGAMYPVLRADGTPFVATWSDLRNVAVTPASATGAQRREERRVQR